MFTIRSGIISMYFNFCITEVTLNTPHDQYLVQYLKKALKMFTPYFNFPSGVFNRRGSESNK